MRVRVCVPAEVMGFLNPTGKACCHPSNQNSTEPRNTFCSPLGKIGYRDPGDPLIIDDPTIKEIAKEVNRTPAQVGDVTAFLRGCLGSISHPLTALHNAQARPTVIRLLCPPR